MDVPAVHGEHVWYADMPRPEHVRDYRIFFPHARTNDIVLQAQHTTTYHLQSEACTKHAKEVIFDLQHQHHTNHIQCMVYVSV